MPLTLDEITEHEKRARREIAERECLLAALKVLRGYTAQGDIPATTEPDRLLANLISFIPPIECKELSVPSPAAPATPPAPIRPPHYIHPELAAIGNLFGNSAKVVKWAIGRMTDDYTVRDLLALLDQEGHGMARAHVSLILANLRNRGEIEQLEPSSGPNPALYRKPANANPPVDEPEIATIGAEPAGQS